MSAMTDRAPVLRYAQYLHPTGSTVYTNHEYCGSCRQHLETPYAHSKTPETDEAYNNGERGSFELGRHEDFGYIRFCPWCGIEFEDEWWKDRTIQNERVIDHYCNPGTHKGDTHEFRGDGPDCYVNHWLGVSGGDRVCWCDPEIEPGLMGCVIRHRDVSYEDYQAKVRAGTGSRRGGMGRR